MNYEKIKFHQVYVKRKGQELKQQPYSPRAQ